MSRPFHPFAPVPEPVGVEELAVKRRRLPVALRVTAAHWRVALGLGGCTARSAPSPAAATAGSAGVPGAPAAAQSAGSPPAAQSAGSSAVAQSAGREPSVTRHGLRWYEDTPDAAFEA